MSIRTVFTASLLVLPLSLASCGTVNSVSTRSEQASDQVSDTQVQVHDLLMQIFLRCKSLRMYHSEPSGLMEAQIDVENSGFNDRSFGWRVVWLDQRGNRIASKTNIWNATSVPAGGSVTLTSLAPTLTATDMSFEIRRSNN